MRTRRREPLSFRTFWYGLEEAWVAAGLFVVIGSLVGLFAVGVIYSNNNTYASDRAHYEEMTISDGSRGKDLSEATRKERKEIARDLLDYEKQNESFDQTVFTDYELGQIKNMAETGEPLELDTHRNKFGDYFRFVYLFPGLPIAWLLLSVALMLAYWDDQIDRTGRRFADLPWRKRWPWICTILFGPVWWATMSISAIRMRNDVIPPNPEVRHRVRIDETDTGEKVIAWPHYTMDTTTSQRMYVDMRVTGTRKHRKQRVKGIKRSIEIARSRMRQSSEDLRLERQQIARLEAEQRELQRMIDAGEDSIPEDVAQQEFDKITALPEVIGFQVVGNTVELIVRAITQYKGASYYIADFRVEIGADTEYANAYRIKSGVLPTWGGSYPVYGGGGSFCFGDRSTLIAKYLEKSQYYEATVLIIDCVRSVNEHHLPDIPYAFTKLSEDELATAYECK